jgi:hypothetical protein
VLIYAAPGATFLALFNGPASLLDLEVGVENLHGNPVGAYAPTGITEIEPGVYVATRTAPAVGGDYVVVWRYSDERHAQQLRVSTAPAPGEPGLLPSPVEVGTLLRARTVDDTGAQQDTFNEKTQPTGAQVEGLAAQAQATVAAHTGPLPDELHPQARHVATLYAAMLVELSYYPEQATELGSAYGRLKELYDAALETLLSAVLDGTPGRKGIYSIPLVAVGRNGYGLDNELLP